MRKRKVIPPIGVFAISAAVLTTPSVMAMPLAPASGGSELAAQLAETSPLILVRHRRGHGIGAGLAAGVLMGGIVASQPRYYYRGYPPYSYYTPAYPAYGPYSAGDPAIVYCMRRFRSYDPYTMTYLGFDGFRHPCP